MNHIRGRCHCGNLSFVLEWSGSLETIPVRACSCTFCQKHGGVYTADPAGALRGKINKKKDVTQYRFGTRTATFHICRNCGVVPFVTSNIDGELYAVVNVNSFEDVEPETFVKAVSNFDGEDADSRLTRRKRTWIPKVTLQYNE